MRSSRTGAERDAATVEMVFAAATGAVLAAIGFLALASPVMAGAAHGTAREGWFTGAVIVAAAIFCGRVSVTLRRFERAERARHADDLAPEPDEESAGGEPAGEQAAAPTGSAELRVPRQRHGSGGPDDGSPPWDQPSQPGRTSPDS